MTAKDAKRKAATAARALLTDRITAVEKLSVALHHYHTAQTAVTQAQTHADQLAELARTAFHNARTAGWTTTELHRAGLTPPPPPKTKNTNPSPPPNDPPTGGDTNNPTDLLQVEGANGQLDPSHNRADLDSHAEGEMRHGSGVEGAKVGH